MKKHLVAIPIFFFLLFTSSLYAQTYVKGVVVEETNEGAFNPVPFANIFPLYKIFTSTLA